MITFHEKPQHVADSSTIAVFKDAEPISAEQRSTLLLRLNRLAGFDDDPLWDDPRSGSCLRVAEMLENHSEPDDVTVTLRRLGGAVIRSLVRELSEKSASEVTFLATIRSFDESSHRRIDVNLRGIAGQLEISGGGFWPKAKDGQRVEVTLRLIPTEPSI